MLGVATHPASREETAVLDTLPWPGSGLQTLPVTGRDPAPVPDPAIFASAVARFRALAGLRGFRQSLYECLKARADALFELADAVLCADHAVTSLVQLCLEPEFTRGHGALYDALSAGRIDDERLFSLLASELPRAVAGPGARARWRLPLPGLQQDRARLGVPVHRGNRAPAHRMGRAHRRGANHARDPHRADDRAGEEHAAPPARRRARPEGRAAVRLRCRLQRRRPR